jgi:hypothetical protein
MSLLNRCRLQVEGLEDRVNPAPLGLGSLPPSAAGIAIAQPLVPGQATSSPVFQTTTSGTTTAALGNLPSASGAGIDVAKGVIPGQATNAPAFQGPVETPSAVNLPPASGAGISVAEGYVPSQAGNSRIFS